MHVLHLLPPLGNDHLRPGVLVDRDGAIVVERHYLSHESQLELLPGAVDGLRKLQTLALPLIVVTNQSAVGRGMFDLEQLDRIHRALDAMLQAAGVRLAAIYSCPHAPDAACACRKPLPGMALAAARDYALDLSRSYAIGDKACDVDLGKNVGASGLLVKTGHGAKAAPDVIARADAVCNDLADAGEYIATALSRTRK